MYNISLNNKYDTIQDDGIANNIDIMYSTILLNIRFSNR